jgi:GNAT superfamily N-acetyltransferase
MADDVHGRRLPHLGAASRSAWQGPFQVDQAVDLEKIRALREFVWRNETDLVDLIHFNPQAERISDGRDADGLHWVITSADDIVAAARLSVALDPADLPGWRRFGHLVPQVAGPVAALNRMVVHQRMRRQGLSRVLTEVRLAAARDAGVTMVFVDAVPNRLRPLQDLGFVDLGRTTPEPYDLVPVILLALPLSAAA